MGYFMCKGKCGEYEKVSRMVLDSKKCPNCNYSTITKEIFCLCCGRKFKIRKFTKKKTDFVRM